MVIDESGTIWLANPWLTAALITFGVALIIWCHRWLETGAAPLPRRVARPVRATVGRTSRLRTLPRQATATRPVAPLLSFRPERTAPPARPGRVPKLPRSA